MAAAGEMGELVAEFQWLSPEQSAAVMDDPEAGARVRAELGDVVIYLTRLADEGGLDKLETSARRYPVESSRGSAAKAPRSSVRIIAVRRPVHVEGGAGDWAHPQI